MDSAGAPPPATTTTATTQVGARGNRVIEGEVFVGFGQLVGQVAGATCK